MNLPSRVGIAEAGYRRLESGDTDEHLTTIQLGRLAGILEFDP